MSKVIPKIIHYCWFGGNPLPDEAIKCIRSWKKYFPDYEIKEWNEHNYKLDSCDYVREAYQAKKWAFVSDYARFDILYKYGGLYFDTDVEVIKPMDDIVEKGSFMGVESGWYESGSQQVLVAPGLGIAAPAGLALYKEIIDNYKNRHFYKKNGEKDTTTVVHTTTKILEKHGIQVKGNLALCEDITIYPKEFFCPKDYNTGEVCITPNTRTIHHYSATWLSPAKKSALALQCKLIQKYGMKKGGKLAEIIIIPYKIADKFYTLGFYGALKYIFNKWYR